MERKAEKAQGHCNEEHQGCRKTEGGDHKARKEGPNKNKEARNLDSDSAWVRNKGDLRKQRRKRKEQHVETH